MPYLEKIKKILCDVLECDELELATLSPDTYLFSSSHENSLCLSSIDFVDFLSCAERDFEIVFDEIGSCQTVADLCEYIDAQKKKDY